MRRLALGMVLAALLATLPAATASAEFGLSEIEVEFSKEDGSPELEAGSHPFQMRMSFLINTREHPIKGVPVVDGALRNLDIVLPAGFTGNPTAIPRCELLDFLAGDEKGHPGCADNTAVGTIRARLGGGMGTGGEETVAIYNMQPAPGAVARFGFEIGEVPSTVNVGVSPTFPHNAVVSLTNASQIVEVMGAETIVWGNPADPAHDPDRGDCAYEDVPGECGAGIAPRPAVTLPRSCSGPLTTTFSALSWWSGEPLEPGPPASFEQTVQSPGMVECAKLGFAPTIDAQPTTDQAESPSGLAFNLDVLDQGIDNPDGTAHSDIQKAVVTFPEGMTANPSLAEGLATCSRQDLAEETIDSEPGEGCPQASKLGTIEAETPILEGKILKGALFIATQDDPTTTAPGLENPFDTLIAQYIVVKDRELGVIAKLAGKLEPDPLTGQLRATFDELPPVPLSHVRLRLREGGRSPLITPPACGPYTTRADLSPSGNPAGPVPVDSVFRISRGVGGGPCPPAGPPPFAPGFLAGSVNNNAGAHTPFHMRLTRRDGDQELTRFDAILPPGLIGKLAGVSRCPDAAIAAAKGRRGRAELASPSCPANSEIGEVAGGAGVGSQLTYVPGKLYLAGPFGGAPLSVVAIVPAVAGPFDVGTIVVRLALRVNPKRVKVQVDGSRSDPIPHILAGIPLKVRDIRVDVGRPQFILNPTSCNPFAIGAEIWGAGSNLFSAFDDAPASRSARFQATNCSRLGFKPRLSLSLWGGTKRGSHPALRGVYRPRPGDANAADAVVRFPRSAFLDQAHFRTICTRVQFAADKCPPGAVYGHVTAITPLLEEPLEGPAYLRSSDNNLPDLVFDLHGLVDVEASARIDSIKGGIRATFEDIPDAPLTKVTIQMQGGKKGLIVNSRNLCTDPARTTVALKAHSAKRRTLRPQMRALGCKRAKR